MKTLIFTLLMMNSTLAFARALDTSDMARIAKSSIENTVFRIKGVNGIGITGCNPRTGQIQTKGDFVYCVSIYTETKSAYLTVLGLYPVGTQVKGVYISTRYIGVISPEQRFSEVE